MATSATAKALVYDTPGEPLEVLRLAELPVQAPNDDEIQLRFLLSPINPSDVNTVQGKYPLQPKLPGGTPGHEGVAEVVAVGPQVAGLAVGDRVVPLQPALGTWRTAGTFKAGDFHRVPSALSAEAAATLCINPPTALAMLQDFVALQPGDTVLQNGANSAVGQAVIQICKAKGFKTVNVIREREDWDETVAFLKEQGADVVTTEAKLKDDLKASGLKAPKLGLNCVGGSSALAVAKALSDGGTVVTYGGMSMQPVTVPTALLVFKDLSFRGFWLSGRRAIAEGLDGKRAMLDQCAELAIQGHIKTTAKTFPIAQYKEAFAAAQGGKRNFKVLLGLN